MKILKVKKLILVPLLILGFNSAFAASVITRTAQGMGSGSNRQDAIQAALKDAIAQVKGLEISSRSKLDTVGTTTTSKSGSDFSSAQLVRESTQTHVEGRVKCYSIVDEKKEKDGSYSVVADVDVSLYQGDPSTQRRRIAVLPFAFKGNNELVIDYDKRLRQGIVDSLTSSRNFAILDKDFNANRLQELASLLRPDVVKEERARIGNTLGADYIVVGDINNFDLQSHSDVDPVLKEKTTTLRGHVSFTWRLIEVATGQIAASDSVDLPIKVRRTADVYALGGKEGQSVGTKINDQIFPLMVLAINGNQVTIGQGGETLKLGARYNLVKFGRVLKNPYTDEPLGRDEFKVGEVEITNVSPKISHATILSSSGNLNNVGSGEFILRAASTDISSTKKVTKTQAPKW